MLPKLIAENCLKWEKGRFFKPSRAYSGMIIRFKNLVVVGTSHISPQSLNEVMYVIGESPSVVALELDANRFSALLGKKRPSRYSLRDIQSVGVKGFLFGVIVAWAEKKLGNLVGVEPGEDMRLAAHEAKKRGIPVVLVDQDVRLTLKKISFSTTEKFRLFVDCIKGLCGRTQIPFDLSEVPSEEVVLKLVSGLHKRYPSLYKVLIEERNRVMAQNLVVIMGRSHGTVMAVVGAGHVTGILSLIKSQKSEYHSLKNH